jgi:hypothetical protein
LRLGPVPRLVPRLVPRPAHGLLRPLGSTSASGAFAHDAVLYEFPRVVHTLACQGRRYHIYNLQDGISDRGVSANRHDAAGTRYSRAPGHRVTSSTWSVARRSTLNIQQPARQSRPPFGGSVRLQQQQHSLTDTAIQNTCDFIRIPFGSNGIEYLDPPTFWRQFLGRTV